MGRRSAVMCIRCGYLSTKVYCERCYRNALLGKMQVKDTVITLTDLFRLDWKQILLGAIDSRPTSWYPLGFRPVFSDMVYRPSELRNASFTVMSSVVKAVEKFDWSTLNADEKNKNSNN